MIPEDTTPSRTLRVTQCIRCGQDHAAVKFYALLQPSEGWSEWGMCPNYNEPIMLAVGGGTYSNHVVAMDSHRQDVELPEASPQPPPVIQAPEPDHIVTIKPDNYWRYIRPRQRLKPPPSVTNLPL